MPQCKFRWCGVDDASHQYILSLTRMILRPCSLVTRRNVKLCVPAKELWVDDVMTHVDKLKSHCKQNKYKVVYLLIFCSPAFSNDQVLNYIVALNFIVKSGFVRFAIRADIRYLICH